MKSNFVDIPTDCPTRERSGWIGDLSLFAVTACYLSNPDKFLIKWMGDVVAQQKEDGKPPYIVPAVGLGAIPYGSAGWADVIETVPYTLYQFYKNEEVLERFYNNIKRWVDFSKKRASKSHIFI